MAEAPLIALDDVSKIYATGSAQVKALDHVSLEIHRGEYVAVMGRSGSGKSTFMNIVGLLDVTTLGEYRLDGHDVRFLDGDQLALLRNRKIGFVFQGFNLLPRMSAQANVELPLSYAGVKRNERRHRATEALNAVGLSDRREHAPAELSGGQQQRVAIARAIATNPALILADEPTGNLDSAATNDVLNLFDELHEQGRTIVMITHEDDVAERARRQMKFQDGHLISDEARSLEQVS